jgi:acyl dehydratase
MVELQLTEMPTAGLAGALWPRKPGLVQGQSIERFSLRLSGARATDVAAYRAICGFPGEAVLPITMPQVVAAPLHIALFTHRAFPLPAMGLVHVSSEIVQRRPIPEDAALDLHVWVEGHRPARRGVEADLMTEVSIDGEVAWTSTTTVLSMSGPSSGEKRVQADRPTPAWSRSVIWSLPTDLGRRYAQIAGDRNPIHMYPWTAKLFGFKRHIIHGMWLLGRAAAEIDMPAVGPTRLRCSFKRPVFLPGSPVFMSGEREGGVGFEISKLTTAKVHMYGWMGPA